MASCGVVAYIEEQDVVGDLVAGVVDIEKLDNQGDELDAGVTNSDGWGFVISSLGGVNWKDISYICIYKLYIYVDRLSVSCPAIPY